MKGVGEALQQSLSSRHYIDRASSSSQGSCCLLHILNDHFNQVDPAKYSCCGVNLPSFRGRRWSSSAHVMQTRPRSERSSIVGLRTFREAKKGRTEGMSLLMVMRAQNSVRRHAAITGKSFVAAGVSQHKVKKVLASSAPGCEKRS